MTKKMILPFAIVFLSGLLYQNCGQSPFEMEGFSTIEFESTALEEKTATVPVALLSAEQVLKSMSSVTGTNVTSTIATEFNSRRSILASGYDLKLITSPMMISVTNLASLFCNETLGREVALAPESRKFFRQVDFNKSFSSLTDPAFEDSVRQLSLSFWGRSPAAQEMQALLEGKQEFGAAMTEAEIQTPASSRSLMLFVCTAMLSSFDSLTF